MRFLIFFMITGYNGDVRHADAYYTMPVGKGNHPYSPDLEHVREQLRERLDAQAITFTGFLPLADNR
jgi:hypothetical protein